MKTDLNFIGRLIRHIDGLMGFRSFKSRIVFSLSVNLLFLLVALLFYINSASKRQMQDQANESGTQMTSTIGKSIQYLMLSGNNELVEDFRKSLVEEKHLADLKIHPSAVVARDFKHLEDKISNDDKVKSVLASGKTFQEDMKQDGGHFTRTLSPIIGSEKCMACHASAKPADVFGVIESLSSNEAASVRHASFMKSLMVVAPVIVLAIVAFLFLITKETIVRPISEINSIVQDIAEGEGDLTQTLEVKSRDEIGELAQGFNKFIEKLHEMIIQIASITAQAASASQQTSASSEQLASGAEQQQAQTSQVATSMEEMSATVQEVAKNAAEASTSAKGAGETARKGGQVVEQTIAGIHRIEHSTRDMAQAIEVLTKNSEQIGNIIGVIDDVADQTNLLALNAAIEAARAGEQGRGFAVVADEVRKLAERTSTSTKEIAAMVKAMQEGTAQAAGAMESGKKNVEEGVKLAEEAGMILKEILGSSQRVVDLIQQVATAAEEQSAAAEEISSNVESVASVAKQTAQGTQQISQAAQEIARLSDNLQGLVNKFKLRDGSFRQAERKEPPRAHAKKPAVPAGPAAAWPRRETGRRDSTNGNES